MMKPHHKRLPSFEPFDEVRMRVIERYKESEMSGDEWRQSFKATLYFKHIELFSISSSRLRDVTLQVLNYSMGNTKSGCIGGSSEVTDKILKTERACCDQPYCVNAPTSFYLLKEEFSLQGDGPIHRPSIESYRQFCGIHKRRGDGAREDSDQNYTDIPDPRMKS